MIEVLISTLDNGIINIPSILINKRPDVKYLIVHQLTHSSYKILPNELKRTDVKIYYLEGSGLSKSRNLAISKTIAEIAIIADDDVSYCDKYFDDVIEVYKNNPPMDVVCFKINTTDSESEYKNYPELNHDLSISIPHYVSSIEITFKPERIRGKGIQFDTRFGLGSKFLPAGEEDIFINDCIKNDLEVHYFPYYIVNHTYQSSGKSRKGNSKKAAHIKGGLYCKLYEKRGFSQMWYDMRFNKFDFNPGSINFKFHLLIGYFYILLIKKINRKNHVTMKKHCRKALIKDMTSH